MENVLLSPVEFVALVNQTFEFAYPYVVIEGEIANFRISKNRWVYFDLKDDQASVKCFGTVYQLPGPLEEGMLIKVSGSPRLHQQFGFSLNVQSIMPSGEGTIKKAAKLLELKLEKEGLFSDDRKRELPYPPQKIGLITSGESAAYADFVKIINARWQGIEILHKDVQVQGEAAIAQVVSAIELFNTHAEHEVEVLVITRGGGSADDLAVFSTEQVTRAVAASRIPTVVAIGHEIDSSLAERAADMRASTPSNAAELLVPDRKEQLASLVSLRTGLQRDLRARIQYAKEYALQSRQQLLEQLSSVLRNQQLLLNQQGALLRAYSPKQVLERGFAVVRRQGVVVDKSSSLAAGDIVTVQFSDGEINARVEKGVE